MSMRISFFFFWICSSLFGQNLKKVEKRIIEGEYEKAEETLKKYIKNNPESCCGYYYYAFLLFQKDNSRELKASDKSDALFKIYCILDSALIFRTSPVSAKEIDEIKFTEEKNEFKDPSFYSSRYDLLFSQFKNKVDNQLLNSLYVLDNEQRLNYYLNYFTKTKLDYSKNYISGYAFESEVKKTRDKVAFDNAKRINTENSFAEFQKKYPNSELFQLAQEFKIKAYYNEVNKLATEVSYNSFIKKYSENIILKNICIYKRDSLIFCSIVKEISINKLEHFIANSNKSIYKNWAIYLLDSLRSDELIKGNNLSEVENYLKSSINSVYYNDLICKLKDLKFDMINTSPNITILSRFYSEYLGYNATNFLVSYKNKKTYEIKDFKASEANSLSDKEWAFVKTTKVINSYCDNDYFFLRDTLYNQLFKLRKSVLKIASQNQLLDKIIFKSNTGKILKYEMLVNDTRQGGIYVNINVNVGPIEAILKLIGSIQNSDQLCFFAFKDQNNSFGYQSFFPGLLNQDNCDQIQSQILDKISNPEIIKINNISKNTYSNFPPPFFYLDNIWNKNPDIQSNIDVHQISFTLANGYDLTIFFNSNQFFITIDDIQIEREMLTSLKWNFKSIDKTKIENNIKLSILNYRNSLYSKQ